MDNPLLLHFVTVVVFSQMFAIGISHSFHDILFIWRQPDLLLRSLLAVIVMVPLVVGLLLWTFDLQPAVAAGLALLAAAPGAPLLTKRTKMAAGDQTYAASLQLKLALLTVVITPLTLAVYYALFELVTERVALYKVALQVVEVTFLPVAIGLFVRLIAPQLVDRIGKVVIIIANVLFLVLFVVLIVLLAVKPDLRAMLNLGWLPTAAIIIMVVLSLGIGHVLGGPTREKRSVLAIASIARNVGLALFIAGLSDYGEKIIPTLMTFTILGAFLAVPYSIWSKRKTIKREIT
jgi:BASS family bile acid:Na+ symporter